MQKTLIERNMEKFQKLIAIERSKSLQSQILAIRSNNLTETRRPNDFLNALPNKNTKRFMVQTRTNQKSATYHEFIIVAY